MRTSALYRGGFSLPHYRVSSPRLDYRQGSKYATIRHFRAARLYWEVGKISPVSV